MNVCSFRTMLSPISLRRLRSTTIVFAAALALAAPDALAQGGKKPPKNQPFNVLPITITSVTPQGGQLVASGLVGTTPFTAPLTMAARPLQDGQSCPVLDLSLAPINLSLLGLNVNTSAICLEITATPGGGLLGDLLCNIANLLNGGLALGDILAGLSTEQLTTLDGGLTQLLNQAVFIPLSSSTAMQEASCSVLSLAIGPLELSLLGLNVELDDCADGPVTLDITATPGGGLLGDLLCSLNDLLNGNATQTAIQAVLRNIAALLGTMVG